jgi:hypothetical protein
VRAHRNEALVLAVLRRNAHRAARAAWLLAATAGMARAADLGQIDGVNLQWDTTLRESFGLRTESADPSVLANINGDDGDRAFTRGLISARLDAFTDITGTKGDFGFDASAQGWFDPVYLQPSANRSAATFNPAGVPANAFPAAVRRLMGEDAELANAFIKDDLTIAGLPVTLRLGRQTLLWGESLFFASNGIAAGQAPVDEIKALGAPLAEARELYLPVTQAVLRVALSGGLALEAYDQVEWRRDRLPGVASFFSTSDILDVGGDRVLLPGGADLTRAKDAVPHGVGQFGVALRLQGGDADFGLYALRYDAKTPEPVYDSPARAYQLVFPSGIVTLGASASSYLGASNVAAELSWRHGMPLVAGSAGLSSGSAGLAVGGGSSVYAGPDLAAFARGYAPPDPPFPGYGGYATGDTWQGQVSTVSQLPPGRWFQGAALSAELAANDLIAVSGGHAYAPNGRTHFAASLRAVFTPSYFQVLPGLDLTVPLGIGYTPLGRSSLDGTENAGSGSVTAGVTATFRAVWQASLSATHFIGGARAQALADRDFVVVSVSRSF